MNAHREVRALLAVAGAIAVVGVIAQVVGVDDHIAAAVLIVAALGWLAVAAVSRERRIRARLADPRTRPASRPGVGAPMPRVVPGAGAPVPPAPTRRLGERSAMGGAS